MKVTEHLTPVLKKLRLSGILDTLELRLGQAVDGNLDYAEFLFRILHDETERRDTKQLSLRIRRANFEHERTLEAFDFTFNPQIPRSKIVAHTPPDPLGRPDLVDAADLDPRVHADADPGVRADPLFQDPFGRPEQDPLARPLTVSLVGSAGRNFAGAAGEPQATVGALTA